MKPGGTTTIPADGMLNLATDGHVTVRGDRVTPGNFVEVTFSFERGEPVTMKVPVVSSDDPVYKDVQYLLPYRRAVAGASGHTRGM